MPRSEAHSALNANVCRRKCRRVIPAVTWCTIPTKREETALKALLRGGAQDRRGPFVRILIVEDDVCLAENLAEALRFVGFQVDHAADGGSGLKLAQQSAVDAITLDLLLPVKTGQDV